MNLAQITIIVYSTLMLVGGIIGFRVAGSVGSLIAGLASTIILDVAFVLTKLVGRVGYLLGAATAFALTVFFAYRIYETYDKGKFMQPSGLMILSILAGILILRGANTAKN